MAVYVDIVFYLDTYLGTLVEAEKFQPYALRASVLLDYLTFNRIAAIIETGTDEDTIEKIKLATCALMDKLVEKSIGIDRAIASESVGSHSVSYVTSEADKSSEMQQYVDCVKIYLDSAGLLYKGFYEDEYTHNLV